MKILDDVTRPFAVLEAGIDRDLAESRRHGQRSFVSAVVLCACALALAVLVVLGSWPPKSVQIPASSGVSDPG